MPSGLKATAVTPPSCPTSRFCSTTLETACRNASSTPVRVSASDQVNVFSFCSARSASIRASKGFSEANRASELIRIAWTSLNDARCHPHQATPANISAAIKPATKLERMVCRCRFRLLLSRSCTDTLKQIKSRSLELSSASRLADQYFASVNSLPRKRASSS